MYFNHPNRYGVAPRDRWIWIEGATEQNMKAAIVLYLEMTEEVPSVVYVSKSIPSRSLNPVCSYSLSVTHSSKTVQNFKVNHGE